MRLFDGTQEGRSAWASKLLVYVSNLEIGQSRDW